MSFILVNFSITFKLQIHSDEVIMISGQMFFLSRERQTPECRSCLRKNSKYKKIGECHQFSQITRTYNLRTNQFIWVLAWGPVSSLVFLNDIFLKLWAPQTKFHSPVDAEAEISETDVLKHGQFKPNLSAWLREKMSLFVIGRTEPLKRAVVR